MEQKLTSPKDSKPIYIVVAVDPTVPSKRQYYLAQKMLDYVGYVDITGWTISKTQIKTIENSPREFKPTAENKEVNRKIVWSRIIRMDNIIYKSVKASE